MLRLILSYITFPGIVMHEFSHAQACRWMGIRVIKTCYLRLGNPMGYVLHERPAYSFQHIMVAVAPFFISSLTAMAVSSAACVFSAGTFLPEYHDMALSAGLWLGFSFALHAFPSRGDADALWDEVLDHNVSLCAKLLLLPVVGLIRLAGAGSAHWLDILFAVLVVAIPPVMLLSN